MFVASTVVCEMLVTNNKNDRNFIADPTIVSKMFDNFNNEYESDRLELANKFSSSSIQLFLISGVQTKVTFQFNKVSTDATQIKRLYLYFRAENNFEIVFNDIPLIR